jgi:long-chain acyl-CoA synthetase
MSKRLLLKELSRYNIGTFADIIYRNSLLYPDRDAFVYEGKRISFSQFNARVNKLINALKKKGVKKGATLGILSWNCLQFAEVYGATMKGGFIASPFNPRLTAGELDYIINYSETDTLFLGPELIETVIALKPKLSKIKNYVLLESSSPEMISYDELIALSPETEPDIHVTEDDPICIVYTSGTTGVPRGALYTQRGLMNDAFTLAIDTGVQPGDKHLQVTPQFHIAGNTWLRVFLLVGACNVIQKVFNPVDTLKLIQDEKITHMSYVPTQMVAMLNVPDLDKYDLSSIKLLWYGASTMPLEVLKKGMKAFGRPIFSEGYGQSESGPAISHMSPQDYAVLDKPENEQQMMSAGRPDIGVHVRIVDENNRDVDPEEIGEIIVRSKHMMVEYWHKPQDTRETIVDGWLHTGDMGYYDEKGFIYIADRKKDMIITGGENVFPREVEEVLYRHSSILEATVIGIPDPYWIEKVHAVIVLKEGCIATSEEIISFCKKHIAGYKTPKSVEFVNSLPKNSAGKIMKRELRNTYWKGHKRKI